MNFFKTYRYSILLSIAFVVFAGFRSIEIAEHNQQYQQHMQQHVAVLNFEERLFNAKEWSLLLVEKAFHFVDDTEWSEKEQVAVQLLLKAENNYNIMLEKSIEIGVAAVALLFILFSAFLKKNIRQQLVIPLFAVCSVFIYLGITTPMLEISASNTDLAIPIGLDLSSFSSPITEGLKYLDQLTGLHTADTEIPNKLETEIVFEGKMYFYYQSKSVIQLIDILFKDQIYLVGIAILLFSIVLPVFKLLLTLINSLSKNTNPTLANLLTYIGKWSMADVFVASCFLAYLSFSNMNVGIDTESKTLVGIYFFFSYVILSLVMGMMGKSTH